MTPNARIPVPVATPSRTPHRLRRTSLDPLALHPPTLPGTHPVELDVLVQGGNRVHRAAAKHCGWLMMTVSMVTVLNLRA